MAEQTFDELTSRTWSRFVGDLARYLRQMQAGDSLVLQSQYDGAVHPASTSKFGGRARLRLSARPGDVFRCEVPRNRFLNPLRTLDRQDREFLYELGFRDPDQCSHEEPAPGSNGSDAYCLDVGPRELASLAEAAVAVFRLMWSVPDPAFLRGQAAGRRDVPEFDAWVPEIDEDATEPSLQIAVEVALADLFGGAAHIDEEGVITLHHKDSPVHLRVHDEERYIDVYASILSLDSDDRQEERDLTREVLDAIPVLNVQWPSVKWHLHDKTLLGIIRIDGAPLMRSHLTRALEEMGALLDSADDILTTLTSDSEEAHHLASPSLLNYSHPVDSRGVPGAGSADADAGERSPSADAIVAVLRLNTSATRNLADHEVADLCDGDVDLVLTCLQIAKAELGHWQSAAADPAMRDQEQQAWGVVIDKLLGAIAALSNPEPDS